MTVQAFRCRILIVSEALVSTSSKALMNQRLTGGALSSLDRPQVETNSQKKPAKHLCSAGFFVVLLQSGLIGHFLSPFGQLFKVTVPLQHPRF